MDFVPIDIAGKTYRLRYTPDDIRDICRRFTGTLPAGSAKATPGTIGSALVNLDPDAIDICLLAALRHMPGKSKWDLHDAQQIVNEGIADGMQYTDFRRPILKAMIACGLADFAHVIKILDDEAARLAQDAGADEGNAETAPETPSPPTRPLTMTSLPAVSGSSMSSDG